MWTTAEKHTKRRETLGNANHNKTTRRAGYNVYGKEKTHQRKHSGLKELYEMLDKTRTLTIARQKKTKEKALK